jgi:hypothetical protein
MKHIDIVTSALNEEDAIEILYERLNQVFKKQTKYTWKLIIFDNLYIKLKFFPKLSTMRLIYYKMISKYFPKYSNSFHFTTILDKINYKNYFIVFIILFSYKN